MLRAVANGAVELMYDNSSKLATTVHGVAIRNDQGATNDAVLRLRGQNTTNRITRLQFEDYSGALADGLIQFRVPTSGTASSAILELGVNSASLTLDHSSNAQFEGNINMTNGDIDYINQLHFQDNVRLYDNGNDSDLNFKYGDTGYGHFRFIDGNGTFQGGVYAESGYFGTLSPDGSWAVQSSNTVTNISHNLNVTGNVSLTSGALSITGDGSNAATLTESSAGLLTIATVDDLVLDSDNDLILDAGGNDIRLKVDGVEYGKFKDDSDDLAIFASIQDKDILFKGNDGGSTITALTLDMSNGGSATFRDDIDLGGNINMTGTSKKINISGLADNQTFLTVTQVGNETWNFKGESIGGGTADYITIGTTSGKVAFHETGGAIFEGDVYAPIYKVEQSNTSTNITASSSYGIWLKNTSDTDGNFMPISFSNSTGYETARIGAEFQNAGDRNTDLFFCTRADSGSLTEQMRITSAGYIGIGSGSPSSYNSRGRDLVIKKTGSDVGISIVAEASGGTDYSSSVMFADGTSGTAGYRGSIEYDHATDVMKFGVAASQDMTLYDSGRLHPAGGVFLGSSNNSNLLDDYEEGTWTPTIRDLGDNAATLATAQGTYTKIGRQVILNYRIELSSKGSMTGNYVLLGGIPFNHPTESYNGTGIVDKFNNMASNMSWLGWDTSSTATVFWLTGVVGTEATSSSYITVAQISDTTKIKGSIIYVTDV